MIESIKKLFGIGPKVDIGELIRNGAIIVDVRSKGEYSSGHVKGSINIPLDQLGSNLAKLKKDKTINKIFYDKDDYIYKIYYVENLKNGLYKN